MRISICGCGWLGLPLAHHLKHQGHQVTGTKRAVQEAADLSAQGIESVAFELGQTDLSSIAPSLLDTELLILNIPPGRKRFTPEAFVGHMTTLLQFAKANGTAKCLFISTSAVYGESTREVFESSQVDPQTDSALSHVALENTVGDVFEQNGTILRLAGLVGGQRHPARFLAGKEGLVNPHHRVNLVHRNDVIDAIDAVVTRNAFGKTLHLCAHEHPPRAEYYTWAAQQLGLTPPSFVEEAEDAPSGKILNANDTCRALDLTLSFASPFDMLAV